ncbi:MAG: hypothetical protein ABSE19_12890 [Candidatus Acidiferrum sp.]
MRCTLESLQLHKALLHLVAQVDQTFGIFAQECAGIGQAHGAGAADKQRLAQGILQLADGQTDGGLRAVKPFGGARETAFLGNGEKNLQFA